jgi:hypothetical protein
MISTGTRCSRTKWQEKVKQLPITDDCGVEPSKNLLVCRSCTEYFSTYSDIFISHFLSHRRCGRRNVSPERLNATILALLATLTILEMHLIRSNTSFKLVWIGMGFGDLCYYACNCHFIPSLSINTAYGPLEFRAKRN